MPTLPNSGIDDIRISHDRNQARMKSEFVNKSYVQSWESDSWILSVTVKLLKEGDPLIDDWIEFFEDCDGMKNTFSVDISRYVPGISGLTNVNFRMTNPNKSWRFDKRQVFGPFTFEAESEDS